MSDHLDDGEAILNYLISISHRNPVYNNENKEGNTIYCNATVCSQNNKYVGPRGFHSQTVKYYTQKEQLENEVRVRVDGKLMYKREILDHSSITGGITLNPDKLDLTTIFIITLDEKMICVFFKELFFINMLNG